MSLEFPEDALALGLIWFGFFLAWLMVYINHKIDNTGQKLDKTIVIVGWVLITPLMPLLILTMLDKI